MCAVNATAVGMSDKRGDGRFRLAGRFGSPGAGAKTLIDPAEFLPQNGAEAELDWQQHCRE